MGTGLALLLLGAGTWWAADRKLSNDEAVELPKKVCNGRISAKSLTPLVPTKGKKLSESAFKFDEPQDHGYCLLEAGGESASITYTEAPSNDLPRKWIQKHGRPATLGDQYGYVSEAGEVFIYLQCTTKSQAVEERLKSGVVISASASTVDGDDLKGSNEQLRNLAEFVAQAARDLHGWYGCDGPTLADGPVTIDWSK
ncbi:hypothetical protein LRS74_13220 [Streptomyces sp. LX-29]|uniref:hypothetical protein n=1 Tax=Streptomyces sp. LX-29 TaxID=2900152 RepID=UPI00240D737B|nr:hypothetical protein [Streptomyces sp. LX-29]WFB07903.1 hypothetical protein LRS74_13220 [Streptomyces sp. LX-29]